MLAGLREALREFVHRWRERERLRRQGMELLRQRALGRKTWANVDAAIEKAAGSAKDNGRISLCADGVLLSILAEPAVAAYLEDNGHSPAQMRVSLEENVSRWPRARPSIVGLQMAGSYQLQAALQRAVVRKMNLNNDRDPTIIDLLEALLATNKAEPGVKDAELRRKVEASPRIDRLLHEVAVLHWLGGFHATTIAKYLAIGEGDVRQEIERTRKVFFPNAMEYRRTGHLGTEQAPK